MTNHNDSMREQYLKRALHLFFCNVVTDLEADEYSVTTDEALEILAEMDSDSNDYGKLVPQELYEDAVIGYLWDMIETTAVWFMGFEPESNPQTETVIGYECSISYYKKDGSLDEELDVYLSTSVYMGIDTERDSFGVPDADIFFYLGSEKIHLGDAGEFYIHSATPVTQKQQ